MQNLSIPIALAGGISTTLGQSFLLHLLFPHWMMVYGLWMVLGLLIFNCAGAGLILFFYQS